ncbi:putative effector 10 [Venturia nashicola]|nr:putative effector 10 [Venturia nashicola]
MKYSLAASFAMAALVAAAPLNSKRDLVYSTATVEEWVTEWSTTTVWEGETPAAAATSTPTGGFYEVPSSAAVSSTNAVVKPSSNASSPSVPAVPVVTSNTSPSTSIAAPTTSTTPVYVAPTTVAPAPTSTYVAPVVETPTIAAAPVVSTSTTPAYVAPAAVTPKAATVATSSSSGGSGTSSGDMTYYDVSVGLTSCGLSGSNSDFLVAMNKADMANGANPNNNPHCNQYIDIYYNGVGPIKGKVVDTCPVCESGAIDVTDSLFKAVAPSGDGRVHGVSWSWA